REEVRRVRRESAATVHAAGTETLRPGGIHHDVIGDVIGRIELERGVVVLDRLVEVGTRPVFEMIGREARLFAGGRVIRIGGAEPEEALERVLVFEVARTTGERKL